MNKRELEQIRDIKKEVEYIQKKIEMADYTIKTWTTSDTVTGSLPFFPYTKHKIHIRGVDLPGYKQEVSRLRSEWRAKLRKLTKKIEGASEYIESISDSEMRLLLTLRFIEGMSWQDIARKIGVAGDGSTERKRVERFFKLSRFS